MKIIIDAYQYSPAITGTDRMAYNFLIELQKIDSTNDYIILCSREKYTRSAISSQNFTIRKPPAIINTHFFGRYLSYIWRRLNKIRLIRLRAHVYYSFHNMSLPGRRIAEKMIASNLDLIPILLDDYKNLGRISYDEQKDAYRRVVAQADRFISISNFSKDQLSEVLNVPSEKIDVVHLAADPAFKPTNKTSRQIEENYIFTIGGSEPRKNVVTVIEAYNQLPANLRKEFKLVIAGGKWHGRKLEYKQSANIIELGYVPDMALPGLYANSSAFIFASTYEGFGFTILEAMAAGAPVINAHGSSLDEVAGSATLSFNPKNPIELTKHLTKILEDNTLREMLVKKGYAQESKFSWEESARKLHSLLIND